MLHILWVIIKIIGIVLLTLLGIILVLLLLVLFLPIQYRVKGEIGENTYAKGSVSWLFHLVAISFRYEMKQMKVFLRILGIPFNIPITEEEKRRREEKRTNKRTNKDKIKKRFFKNKKKNKKNKAITVKNDTSSKINSISEDEPIIENREEKIINSEPNEQSDNVFSNVNNDSDETKEKQSKREKKSFFTIIKEKIKKLKYTIKSICVKMKEIFFTLSTYKDLWEEERVQLAVNKIKAQMIYFLKHLKPKKFDLYLHYGLSDPATTGQLLGGISIFYPIFHKNVKIIPDFEQEILEGKLLIKGRLQVFLIVRIFISLYWDKNIKYSLRRLQKLKEKID